MNRGKSKKKSNRPGLGRRSAGFSVRSLFTKSNTSNKTNEGANTTNNNLHTSEKKDDFDINNIQGMKNHYYQKESKRDLLINSPRSRRSSSRRDLMIDPSSFGGGRSPNNNGFRKQLSIDSSSISSAASASISMNDDSLSSSFHVSPSLCSPQIDGSRRKLLVSSGSRRNLLAKTASFLLRSPSTNNNGFRKQLSIDSSSIVSAASVSTSMDDESLSSSFHVNKSKHTSSSSSRRNDSMKHSFHGESYKGHRSSRRDLMITSPSSSRRNDSMKHSFHGESYKGHRSSRRDLMIDPSSFRGGESPNKNGVRKPLSIHSSTHISPSSSRRNDSMKYSFHEESYKGNSGHGHGYDDVDEEEEKKGSALLSILRKVESVYEECA